MNRNENIFTRTRKHIDIRVWVLLIFLFIVSFAFLSYKIAGNIHCSPIEISLKGYTAGKSNNYYLGEEISFAALMQDEEKISWDFGDHSNATGKVVTHKFSSEGTYTVAATVNGKCVEFVTITISELRQPVSLNTTIQNPISGADAIRAQESASFLSSTNASSYEWTVLNAPDFPIQTTQTATYTFLSPGTRIIELKLDGDAKKTFRKTIQVLPAIAADSKPIANEHVQPIVAAPISQKEEKPKEKAPEKPKSVVIPNEEFANLLNQVTDGKKDLQSFNQYLCNGEKTKVLANGTDWETLVSLYQKINGKKKYDIKSVEAVRDPETNCVTILKVKYRKRALGIF